MESVRFDKFTLLIDGIHKSINKLKLKEVSALGIKAVHVPWLYQLYRHESGMTAAEIASVSMVDRSLVSREIEHLMEEGLIASTERRYTLTDRGRELTSEILDIMLEVQNAVDDGITEEELSAFYQTLEKLNDNFSRLVEKRKRKRTTKE